MKTTKFLFIGFTLSLVILSPIYSYELSVATTNSGGATRTSSNFILQDSIGTNFYNTTSNSISSIYYGILIAICQYSPLPPSTPTIKLTQNKSLIISWNAPRCLNTFNIYRKKSTGTYYEKINAIPILATTTYEDLSVDFSSFYSYKITSISNCKESSLSLSGESIEMKPNISGDTNDDGIVKLNDVGPIIYLYDLTKDSPKYSQQADCNRDGKIDYKDIELIVQNYDMTPATFMFTSRELNGDNIAVYVKNLERYKMIKEFIENMPPSEEKNKALGKIIESINLAEKYILTEAKIKLTKGWNLISFPPNHLNSISSLCEELDCNKYQIFQFTNNSYKKITNETDNNIKIGTGFWIKSNEEKEIVLTATMNKEDTKQIKINEGWNLIGNSFDFPIAIKDLFSNINGIKFPLWEYKNGNYLPVQETDFLLPYHAYWIYSQKEFILNVDSIK